MTPHTTPELKRELNRIYSKHEHYFQDIMNEGFAQNDYDKIFSDFESLLHTLEQKHRAEAEEIKKPSTSKEVWVKIGGHWFQSMQTIFKISPSFDEEDSALYFADSKDVEKISLTYQDNKSTTTTSERKT